MSYGDDTFYNIIGEPVNRTILLQKIIDSYNKKYPNIDITDFNEGSVIRNLLESITTEVYHMELHQMQVQQIAFLQTTYGSYLDLKGEEYNLTRVVGTSSFGELTFSISEAISSDIIIPEGTAVNSTSTGLTFYTSMQVTIPAGNTSVSVNAYCGVYGSNGNVPSGDITVFRDSKPFNMLTVTNNTAFTGGSDRESDEDYRARILEKKSIEDFGSLPYYENLAKSIDGVHDVLIIQVSIAGIIGVLVNGDEKPLPETVLDEVNAVFNDASKVVCCHTFEIEEVDYTSVDLEIECDVSSELDEGLIIDDLTALFNGGDASTTWYNGLNINQSISNYQIVSCLENIIGLEQVTNLTSDGSTFNKITPKNKRALQLTDVSITQNVI